ncbi:MAG: toprim domain-containing protein [Rubrivivax sp.]|nr:toprim domain-containing protein [Rubrivivax sp.]
MNDTVFEHRIDEAKRRAHGRWSEILRSLGVDERILGKRNGPCPSCGGTDRFQYTDKFGEGNYHCRHCGAGGGFKLLQAALGLDFATALRQVESCVGAPSPAPSAPPAAAEPSAQRMRRLAQRLWDEALPVQPGDEVDCYLRRRGLHLRHAPGVLRRHPALGYYEKNAAGRSCKVADYPAMLACIQGPDGHAVTLHRTYLKDGEKAPVPDARKVLSAGINGAAVRLCEPAHELAVAEGIETALAVHLATGKPAWAAVSAGNLEKLWLPEAVRQVCIYADNDADGGFEGQACAYALARRLTRSAPGSDARQVRVFLPRQPGHDWADVWRMRSTAPEAQAA